MESVPTSTPPPPPPTLGSPIQLQDSFPNFFDPFPPPDDEMATAGADLSDRYAMSQEDFAASLQEITGATDNSRSEAGEQPDVSYEDPWAFFVGIFENNPCGTNDNAATATQEREVSPLENLPRNLQSQVFDQLGFKSLDALLATSPQVADAVFDSAAFSPDRSEEDDVTAPTPEVEDVAEGVEVIEIADDIEHDAVTTEGAKLEKTASISSADVPLQTTEVPAPAPQQQQQQPPLTGLDMQQMTNLEMQQKLAAYQAQQTALQNPLFSGPAQLNSMMPMTPLQQPITTPTTPMAPVRGTKRTIDQVEPPKADEKIVRLGLQPEGPLTVVRKVEQRKLNGGKRPKQSHYTSQSQSQSHFSNSLDDFFRVDSVLMSPSPGMRQFPMNQTMVPGDNFLHQPQPKPQLQLRTDMMSPPPTIQQAQHQAHRFLTPQPNAMHADMNMNAHSFTPQPGAQGMHQFGGINQPLFQQPQVPSHGSPSMAQGISPQQQQKINQDRIMQAQMAAARFNLVQAQERAKIEDGQREAAAQRWKGRKGNWGQFDNAPGVRRVGDPYQRPHPMGMGGLPVGLQSGMAGMMPMMPSHGTQQMFPDMGSVQGMGGIGMGAHPFGGQHQQRTGPGAPPNAARQAQMFQQAQMGIPQQAHGPPQPSQAQMRQMQQMLTMQMQMQAQQAQNEKQANPDMMRWLESQLNTQQQASVSTNNADAMPPPAKVLPSSPPQHQTPNRIRTGLSPSSPTPQAGSSNNFRTGLTAASPMMQQFPSLSPGDSVPQRPPSQAPNLDFFDSEDALRDALFNLGNEQ